MNAKGWQQREHQRDEKRTAIASKTKKRKLEHERQKVSEREVAADDGRRNERTRGNVVEEEEQVEGTERETVRKREL